jgi:hypothetical protein
VGEEGQEVMSMTVTHAFEIGARVEVLANRGRNGDQWVRAIIRQREPYLGRPGYYVSYPEAREMWECHGGWMPEHLVRKEMVQ